MNLKVGAHNFFWLCPYTCLQVLLVVIVSTFVMVGTVWSVSCLLFYSRCPRAQPAVKVGVGTCPPVPYGVCATVYILHYIR